MPKIVLYTTHCPKCTILTKKMQSKNIPYTEVTDVELMKSKGITSVPMLEVGENLLDFSEANRWINTQEDIL